MLTIRIFNLSIKFNIMINNILKKNFVFDVIGGWSHKFGLSEPETGIACSYGTTWHRITK